MVKLEARAGQDGWEQYSDQYSSNGYPGTRLPSPLHINTTATAGYQESGTPLYYDSNTGQYYQLGPGYTQPGQPYCQEAPLTPGPTYTAPSLGQDVDTANKKLSKWKEKVN